MNPLQEAACDEQDRRTSLSLADRSTGLNAGQDCVTPKIVDPECAELLHGLNNVLVGMLLNAQVLEWKLPSYSRLKRNLHEIERNAQRGGELVKAAVETLRTASQRAIDRRKQWRRGCCHRPSGDCLGERGARFGGPYRSGGTRIAGTHGHIPAENRKKVPHTPV